MDATLICMAAMASEFGTVGKRDRFSPRQCLGSGFAAMPEHAFAFKDDPDDPPEDAPIEVKEIASRIDASIDRFGGLIEKQEKEIKQFGETSKETASQIAQAEKDLQEMGGELKDLQTRFTDLEKKTGRAGVFGGGSPEAFHSLGEVFVGSEAYKEYTTDRGAKASKSVETEKSALGGAEAKGTLSSASGSAGQVIRPDRRQDILTKPMETPRLRDLLMATPTSSNSVEYLEQTELHMLHGTVTADVGASATVPLDNTRGFYAGQEVQVDGVDNTVASVSHDDGEITLDSSVTITKGKGITSTTFEATPETKLAPNAQAKYELKSVKVIDLPFGLPMTRQILEDAPRLQSTINGELMEGLKLVEEHHILYGDGGSNQLQGIMTHGSVPTFTWSNGTVGDTKYDAIRRAMTIARLAGYPVTGIVLHPDDLEDIETAKGSDGHYINMVSGPAGQRVAWRVPYVETSQIKSGEALIGAFGLAAELFDRMQAVLRIAEEHSDFFMRRMLQMLIEERVALAIKRPQAFVKLDFDEEPS